MISPAVLNLILFAVHVTEKAIRRGASRCDAREGGLRCVLVAGHVALGTKHVDRELGPWRPSKRRVAALVETPTPTPTPPTPTIEPPAPASELPAPAPAERRAEPADGPRERREAGPEPLIGGQAGAPPIFTDAAGAPDRRDVVRPDEVRPGAPSRRPIGRKRGKKA